MIEVAAYLVVIVIGIRVLWKAHMRLMNQLSQPVTPYEEVIDEQREKDIADLKRQGYTDEIIAVILPTINNGQ